MATDPSPSGAGARGPSAGGCLAGLRAALLCWGLDLWYWDLDTPEIWSAEAVIGSADLRELSEETAAMPAPNARRKKLELICDLDPALNCGMANGRLYFQTD